MCCDQTEFIQKLINEIVVMSELGETPAGDSINIKTWAWATEWVEVFKQSGED